MSPITLGHCLPSYDYPMKSISSSSLLYDLRCTFLERIAVTYDHRHIFYFMHNHFHSQRAIEFRPCRQQIHTFFATHSHLEIILKESSTQISKHSSSPSAAFPSSLRRLQQGLRGPTVSIARTPLEVALMLRAIRAWWISRAPTFGRRQWINGGS